MMWLLFLLLLLQIDVPEDVPPLAYTNWDTSFEFFTVHDLTTGETSRVDQPEGYAGIYTGRTFRADDEPIEYESTSPSGNVIIVREEIRRDSPIIYSLLMPGADEPFLTDLVTPVIYWSEDAQFFYAPTHDGLIQYDMQTGTTIPITDELTLWLRGCLAERGCLILVGDYEAERQVFRLDLNTAEKSLLLTVAPDDYADPQWLPEQNHLAVVDSGRRFLLFEDDTVVLELETNRITDWEASSEWAVFLVRIAEDEPALNLMTLHLATGETVTYPTEYLPFYDIQLGLEWLPGNRIIFSASTDDAPRGAVFVLDVDASEVYQTVAFEQTGTHHDQAWSPDGDWFAYLDGTDLFIVPWDGSAPPQQIETEAPVNCIAWEADYPPGTLICDKNWGMG